MGYPKRLTSPQGKTKTIGRIFKVGLKNSEKKIEVWFLTEFEC